jgi:hypothetical protein
MVSGCHAGDVDRLLARPPDEGDDVNPVGSKNSAEL